MTPPPLTPQQRADALQKARQVRGERAEVRANLKNGTVTLAQVIATADENDVIAKMKVFSLLTAVPGVGQARAEKIMTRNGIAGSRRIRGLGANQRAGLLSEHALA